MRLVIASPQRRGADLRGKDLEQPRCELFVLADDPGNSRGVIGLPGWLPEHFPAATRPTMPLRNPVSPAKSPPKLVLRPARPAVTADVEITARGPPPGVERRPPPSSFRGVVTTPSDNTTDIEELKGISDQSIDLAICIGAFEHMLDKRAVLASIHRVLKFGGRFFCLTLNADYIWYRTIAPLLGFPTKHLASDRILTQDEFSALLDEAGFRRRRFGTWTFIPKGDMSAVVALPLTALDAIGRYARLDSLRGGLSLCAWKEATLG